ncbi:MAG: ferric reductase-like transmembrane domain-containing protein [Acidimicrobiales bacterium]|jgi:DMSO/TMAO reductase YedYZ heme-binding membrane subunit
MTSTSLLAVSGASSKALWYLTRSTGLVALILLTATVVVGVVASVGWTTQRWPRFLSQHVHRNLSLFCVGFVAVHVITTVGDGYVPIGIADAFIPFRTPYRPLWVGLGALTFDLLLAVLITSALRHRIGFASWRFVHWLAYLCWPIAMLHGLGSGSDSALPIVLFVDVVCAAAVFGTVAWRLSTGRTFTPGARAGAAVATVVVAVGIAVFAFAGPLRPGWSHRAGTSAALLAQLARKNAATAAGATAGVGTQSTATTAPATGSGSAGVPTAPFTVPLTGSQTTTNPNGQGAVQVTLTMQLQNTSGTPLTVVLDGSAAGGGGVSLSSGSVTFGPYHGVVTGLNGGTVAATVSAPNPLVLTMQLNVNQNSGALSGTVTGTSVGSQR